MRKPVVTYDVDHRLLIEDKSVVRWADNLYMYHGAWIDPKTGYIKLLVSALNGGKMRLIHNKDRKHVHLEYTMA